MSLINDALKKARQAQANAPVRESAPQLRSPAADHPVRTGPSLVLPALIIVVLLLGGGLVWFGLGARTNAAREAARNAPAMTSAPVPAVASTLQPVVPAPRPVDSATQSVAATIVVPTSPPVGIQPAVIATPTPAQAPPKSPALNGIFFNPARPTAVVNNKLVSPGSRVGEYTVMAITQTSVTLVSGSRTNVLSLSE
jgi:hypothetical protein